jgi:hypothetical protein
VFAVLIALTGASNRPRVNHNAINGDDTLWALNMGDEVALWFVPNPGAAFYRLQVARTYNGSWTTLATAARSDMQYERDFVDNLECVPGRFMPDLTADHVYYRLLLVNDVGRVFRIYPPVRVPPWIDEHPEESSAPIDPNTPVTEMNAVDPKDATESGC